MRLALASLLLLTGCASETVPASSAAPGVKRLGSAVASRPLSVKARPLRRHLPSTASRDLHRRPVAHIWTLLARCESGGDWHANTSNGYYGGVQESLSFWRSFGGLRFSARPDLASRREQVTVARRGLAAQGWGAWPVCSVRIGVAR